MQRKKTNWRFLIVHKSDKGNPARKKKSHGNPYRTAPAGRKAGRSLYRHDAGHSVSGPGAAERYGLDHPPCRRRHLFSPKRLSSRAGLCGSRRVGRRPVRRRPYYLSAQNTRKGNRHRTPEKSQLWNDGLCRTGGGRYRHIANRDIYGRFARACVDRYRRPFELRFGIADLLLVQKGDFFTECNNSPCIHKYSYIKAPAVRNENRTAGAFVMRYSARERSVPKCAVSCPARTGQAGLFSASTQPLCGSTHNTPPLPRAL